MKNRILSILLLAAMLGAALFAPLQFASAAPLSPITTVNPLVVTLSPLTAVGTFQAGVLYNGKQPLFGLSVSSLSATVNGVSAKAVVDNFGKITITTGNTIGTYCVALSVSYAGVIGTSGKVCHIFTHPSASPITVVAVNPIVITLTPISAPARGFQANVLYNGKRPIFGLSRNTLTATVNGISAPVSIDNFGKINMSGVMPGISPIGKFCVTISVKYAGISNGPTSGCYTY